MDQFDGVDHYLLDEIGHLPPENNIVVQSTIHLHGRRPAIYQNPTTRLRREFFDARTSLVPGTDLVESVPAHGFRESHRIGQVTRKPAAERTAGTRNAA